MIPFKISMRQQGLFSSLQGGLLSCKGGIVSHNVCDSSTQLFERKAMVASGCTERLYSRLQEPLNRYEEMLLTPS